MPFARYLSPLLVELASQRGVLVVPASFQPNRDLPYGPAHDMFTSWVAALDIALVFKIFKGDVRLT
jgi:hypothetical protein